jgi:uncharacterized protein (DUF2147 family)
MQFHRVAIVVAISLLLVGGLAAQTPVQKNAVGHWQVVKENGATGAEVVTYLENGKLYGKITQRDRGADPNGVCSKCSGSLKDQKVLGLIMIRDFVPDGDGWTGGIVVDPENGKEYKGKIKAVGNDQLSLRGYIGIPMLGRTQMWKRLQ